MVTAVGAASLQVGCTPEQYAEQADEAAYETLRGGQIAALGRQRPFEVDYEPFPPEEDDEIRVGEKVIRLAPAEEAVLTLPECLRVAMRNSRRLQDRKDDLYREALALANSRRGWIGPLFDGPLSGEVEDVRTEGGGESSGLEAAGEVSLLQRLRDGGVLVLAAGLDMSVDFLAGDTVAASFLDATFTQPLLRGAWRDLAYEDQHRRERDFLFAVWDYQRFRQTFAAGIVTSYYSVLRQRDQLANEETNIERLEQTVALTAALAAGGEASEIEVDQARQDLLRARSRFEVSTQEYENTLDTFKIALGLPVRAAVELNYPDALENLRSRGRKAIPFAERQAIQIALSTRPDVLRQRAKVRDAERNVVIAADAFLPQVDLLLGANVPSDGTDEWYELRPGRLTRTASLSLEYNLDQRDNRDAYRNALLSLSGAQRDWDEFRDEVRLEVRDVYRTLQQSERNYEIQVENVRIAERRTKLAKIEQEQGQASARDVLEAQEALRNARNSLTQALVRYSTTRLEFLATLGLLSVDEEGVIHERDDPRTFKRIGRVYPYLRRP